MQDKTGVRANKHYSFDSITAAGCYQDDIASL
jgi:hypothetical protein